MSGCHSPSAPTHPPTHPSHPSTHRRAAADPRSCRGRQRWRTRASTSSTRRACWPSPPQVRTPGAVAAADRAARAPFREDGAAPSGHGVGLLLAPSRCRPRAIRPGAVEVCEPLTPWADLSYRSSSAATMQHGQGGGILMTFRSLRRCCALRLGCKRARHPAPRLTARIARGRQRRTRTLSGSRG